MNVSLANKGFNGSTKNDQSNCELLGTCSIMFFQYSGIRYKLLLSVSALIYWVDRTKTLVSTLEHYYLGLMPKCLPLKQTKLSKPYVANDNYPVLFSISGEPG